jgi:hypothetical protein
MAIAVCDVWGTDVGALSDHLAGNLVGALGADEVLRRVLALSTHLDPVLERSHQLVNVSVS